eukprot:5653547-Alexandrium_andersonii.AAC.1
MHRARPSRASGASVKVVLGAAQFKFRMPEAVLERLITVGTTRRRRCKAPLGSIGTQCSRRRAHPT